MKQVSVHASVCYDILIEKGCLERCGQLCAQVFAPKSSSGQRCAAIVSDDTVAGLYLEQVQRSLEAAGFRAPAFVFPHGEDSKSQKTLFDLYDFLVREEVTRSDFLVALGGGVVGDLCGFGAASYLRGLPFVQIPTTFLAAIDSSVGGKTAINIPAGKNLVGAFHQPSLVICDPLCFDTLPPETFADGVAEAVKYGMIASVPLLEQLEKGDLSAEIEDIIAQCVSIKRDVVEEDEQDRGARMVLNYGHTLGHAIEKVTNHAVTHGQGVAMGMVLIAKLGQQLGLQGPELGQRLERCLASYGLPTQYSGSIPALGEAVLHDKKRAGSKINLVLVTEAGKAFVQPVALADFLKELEAL